MKDVPRKSIIEEPVSLLHRQADPDDVEYDEDYELPSDDEVNTQRVGLPAVGRFYDKYRNIHR